MRSALSQSRSVDHLCFAQDLAWSARRGDTCLELFVPCSRLCVNVTELDCFFLADFVDHFVFLVRICYSRYNYELCLGKFPNVTERSYSPI